MKYIILKSTTLLCYQFAEQNGAPLQILCFERKKDFEDYLRMNQPAAGDLPVPRLIDADRINTGNILPQSGNASARAVSDGFFVHHKDRFVKIRFADILWAEASRSYSHLHLKDGSSVMLGYPLAVVKQKLPADTFMQIHRSFVVNLPQVDGFIGNMLYVGKAKLPVSKPHRREVFSKFTFIEIAKPTVEEEGND